jgi:hypothetical protein
MGAVQERISDENLPPFLGGNAVADDDHDDFDMLCQPVPEAKK